MELLLSNYTPFEVAVAEEKADALQKEWSDLLHAMNIARARYELAIAELKAEQAKYPDIYGPLDPR